MRHQHTTHHTHQTHHTHHTHLTQHTQHTTQHTTPHTTHTTNTYTPPAAAATTAKATTSSGAGHLVVVEGLSTCQDSHLTGKPRAGQGSLLRVAQGVPQGMGEDPRTVHTDAESLCPFARSCTLRGRDESSCGSGHSPAIVDAELVVSLKTHRTNYIDSPWAALLRVLFVPGRVCCDHWRA